MEENELLHARLIADVHTFFPRAVSPALFLIAELLPAVLRVVDEGVRAARQFAKRAVELRRARLVVRRVDDGLAAVFDAKRKASLRMIDALRDDGEIIKLERA